MSEQLDLLGTGPFKRPAASMVFDRPAAIAAGEAGMETARLAERVQSWRGSADAWLARQPLGWMFVADDLVSAIGLPDEGVYRNNAVGGVVSAWSKVGLIEHTGRRRRSARKIGHGNEQKEWRIVARPAA